MWFNKNSKSHRPFNVLKNVIQEIKCLEFILETKGKFPYSWAVNIQLFDLNKIKKRLKELKGRKKK